MVLPVQQVFQEIYGEPGNPKASVAWTDALPLIPTSQLA